MTAAGMRGRQQGKKRVNPDKRRAAGKRAKVSTAEVAKRAEDAAAQKEKQEKCLKKHTDWHEEWGSPPVYDARPNEMYNGVLYTAAAAAKEKARDAAFRGAGAGAGAGGASPTGGVGACAEDVVDGEEGNTVFECDYCGGADGSWSAVSAHEEVCPRRPNGS